MNVSTFLDLISDLGFALDKIEIIKNSVDLTNEENQKILLAGKNIADATKTVRELFPTIKSLDTETRRVLKNELL